jgi:DNA helicase HerA-like ATPase
MPVRPTLPHFGDVQKMMAQAFHDAGQTDREIADAIGVPVNNIIHWRREAGLREHPAPPRPADDVNWTSSGDFYKAARPAGQTDREIADAIGVPVPFARPAPLRAGTPSAVSRVTATALGDTHQPTGDRALEIGAGIGGRKAFVDLEELLTTRLLIQGNSGSGKSHLLRKLLEEAANIIQQIIIDPEGDFASFEQFGHVIIDAAVQGVGRMTTLARRVRENRASVVLNLEGFDDPEQQMDAVAAFLTGLFDAPVEHWHPALVAIDEAQMFAPTSDNGEDRDTRKASLAALTNLMCRGRKRGLAGILATQRIAKLHKNVAAEASNFLVGRTFLDIDMARAADLMGLAKRDADQIRDLSRGEFLGLGPAISRRVAKVRVGDTITKGKSAAQGLSELPSLSPEAMSDLILAPDPEEEAPVPALRVVK